MARSAEIARFSHYVLVQCLFAEPPMEAGLLVKTVGGELRKFRKDCGNEKTYLPTPLLQKVLKLIWGGM